MSNALNRTTVEYRKSINTPDYPIEDWIIDPDLSAVSAIPIRYWKINGDSVLEMTAEEKAAVDKVISDKKFVISGFEDVTKVDYDLLGLHKKRTISGGELKLVEYFLDYDGTTYSGLAVKEDRIYTRDPTTNLAIKRNMTITWFLADGTVGATKDTEKFYSAVEAYEENKTLRENILNQASMYLLSQIGLANGIAFLAALDADNRIGRYRAGAKRPLLQYITDCTDLFITVEIRATLLALLT